jgi:ABC-type dipeptide/oligopeptide/nickel transport system permease subunit
VEASTSTTPGLAKRLGQAGAVTLALFLMVALLAPLLAPYPPDARVGPPLRSPSPSHLLGTNDIGQDILSELIYGSRISLLVGVAAATVSTVLGGVVSLVAGYTRGWIDRVLMRTVDLVLVVPFVPLLIVLAAYLGRGVWTQILILSLVLWARPARVVRSQVLSTRRRLYVEASRTYGASSWQVLWRHVLPAVTPLVIVQFVRAVQIAVLLEAALSFLGLGDPVRRSWGTIVYYATARSAFLTDAWLWWIVPPGLCIAFVVVAFAFVGLWLEERVDPRLASAPRR